MYLPTCPQVKGPLTMGEHQTIRPGLCCRLCNVIHKGLCATGHIEENFVLVLFCNVFKKVQERPIS